MTLVPSSEVVGRVVLGTFIVVVWTWRTLRPYLVLRDIRSGAIAPEADVLFMVVLQTAFFLIFPVVTFVGWQVRQAWVIVLLFGMFVSGCTSLYFGIRAWTTIKQKRHGSSSQSLHRVLGFRAGTSPGEPQGHRRVD